MLIGAYSNQWSILKICCGDETLVFWYSRIFWSFYLVTAKGFEYGLWPDKNTQAMFFLQVISALLIDLCHWSGNSVSACGCCPDEIFVLLMSLSLINLQIFDCQLNKIIISKRFASNRTVNSQNCFL